MKQTNYGATPQDWFYLSLGLGLGDDLLPVVSNPNAVISEKSNMKGVGKTPSWYNASGEAAGISKWTDRMAEAHEIEKWAEQPDYGICIQTRHVRALDIDVDDRELAADINDLVIKTLEAWGITELAIRTRSNSGKMLFAFRVEGEIPKSVFKVNGGIIERLGNGQQFVAYGTHTSGVRYEWNDYSDFPTLTLQQWDSLWEKLAILFATEAPKEGRGPRQQGTTLSVFDPMTQKLSDAGLIIDYGNDGQAFIECPWKIVHSSDSGETETAYFPIGTRGYAVGHFKCMHASCMNRTDFEFESELLGINDDFEDLPAIVEEPGKPKTMALGRLSQDKNGIDAQINNIAAILDHPGNSGYHLVKDVFLDEHMICPVGESKWVMVDDLRQVQLRSKLEGMGFKEIGREKMRDAVMLAGAKNQIDSAQQWLGTLVWDGIPRIDNFFARYFGGVDTPYTRGVAKYLWTALAGRVMSPGCQADMMPILVGDQGMGKSSAIRLLVPRPELFGEISFDMPEADLARVMKGKLIVEVPELNGLHTREVEPIKATVTRRIDEWVPKYMEKATFYARRAIMMGTTNRTDILADSTGNRRFPPVAVGRVDTAALAYDRNQLWAEGLHRWGLHGVQWQEAQDLAVDVQQSFMVTDSWEESIDAWLSDITQDASDSEPVHQTRHILQDALGVEPARVKRADEERVRKIMQVRGYVYGPTRVNGAIIKGWRKKVT